MNSLAFFNPRFTSDLFDVIDRNLADFMPAEKNGTSSMPKVDVRETPDAYILDMDLPGVSEKDVDINLKDRVLSISSKKEEKKKKKKTENGSSENAVPPLSAAGLRYHRILM